MRFRNIAGDIGQTGKSVLSREAVPLEMNPGSFLGLRLRLQRLQEKEKKNPITSSSMPREISQPWLR